MLGAIIGDIVGSRFEFNNYRSTDFELFTEDCFFTDDTVMTLAIAKALMRAEPYAGDKEDYNHRLSQLAVSAMQDLGRRYPECGYGGNFIRWVRSDDPKPYGSWGNGAAMRIAPVGWLARTEGEVETLAQIVTEVTHNHEEGIKGAVAVALAIYLARRNYTKQEIAREMEDFYDLDFTIDQIRPTYQFSESCQKTVPPAIVAFLESSSFEDAIRLAVSVGGDSDTLAAITGAIAEAYYGIPDDLRKIALGYLDEELRQMYRAWADFLQDDQLVHPFKVLTKYRALLMDQPAKSDELMALFAQEYTDFEKNRADRPSDRAEYLAQSGIWMDPVQLAALDPDQLNGEMVLALIGAAMEYELLTPELLIGWLKRLEDIERCEREIEEIYFRIGYKFEHDTYVITLGDSATMTHKSWCEPKDERHLSIQEIDQFQAAIRQVDLSTWRPVYFDEDDRDGVKWQVAIKQKGLRRRFWEGENLFPPNWDAWLSLFITKDA